METSSNTGTHAHAYNIDACIYMYYFHVFFLEKYIDRSFVFLFTLTHALTYLFWRWYTGRHNTLKTSEKNKWRKSNWEFEDILAQIFYRGYFKNI